MILVNMQDVGLPGQFQVSCTEAMTGIDWRKEVDPDLLKHMQPYRSVTSRWQDLLRLIRIMHRHFDKVKKEIFPAMHRKLEPTSRGIFRCVSSFWHPLLL